MGVIKRARMNIAVRLAKRALANKREARKIRGNVFNPQIGRTEKHLLKGLTRIPLTMQPSHGLYRYTNNGKIIVTTKKGLGLASHASKLDASAERMKRTARIIAGKNHPTRK